MKRTRNQPQTTPGFAVQLTDDTDLGIGMLIAEDDAGGYLPLGPVSTISEARWLAQRDLRQRMLQVERGASPFCPAVYKVWARGLEGHLVAAEFDAAQL